MRLGGGGSSVCAPRTSPQGPRKQWRRRRISPRPVDRVGAGDPHRRRRPALGVVASHEPGGSSKLPCLHAWKTSHRGMRAQAIRATMAGSDQSGGRPRSRSVRERRAIVRHIRTESGREWAAYLESAMRSAGLTQAELARRSGLAESMVSRWLRGLNQPDVPNLRRVRPVLGVPMLELIVAAGYLSLEEAELQDAPQPPAPVQVGISTEGLTIDQVRQLEGFATFLRAQNGPARGRARSGRGAGRAAALRRVRRGEAEPGAAGPGARAGPAGAGGGGPLGPAGGLPGRAGRPAALSRADGTPGTNRTRTWCRGLRCGFVGGRFPSSCPHPSGVPWSISRCCGRPPIAESPSASPISTAPTGCGCRRSAPSW